MAGYISGPSRLNSARLAFAILAGAASLSAETADSKVTAVRYWSLGDVTRVAIEVSSEFHYRSQRLDAPARLFFDIVGARPEIVEKGMRIIPVGDSLIKQIRVAETQPGVTRVVLDLAQPVEFNASQLSNPQRLMIELHSKDHSSPTATTSVTGWKKMDEAAETAVSPDIAAAPAPEIPSKPEPSKPEPSKPEPKKFELPPARPVSVAPSTQIELPLPPPMPSMNAATRLAAHVSMPVRTDFPPPGEAPIPAIVSPAPVTKPAPSPSERFADATPAKRNTNGDRSLTRVLGLKLGRVVIDPGHGGHDAGTHGPSGLLEKDVVLDVSKRLGALIQARLGSEVIYTRSDDTFIPLEQRTQIANDHKADLFLSIHANSSPLRTAAGVETYYLNFTTSRAALDVAARENASSERSIYDLRELLQKIALKDKIDESREFASRLESSLYTISARSNAAARNRGVKKAPFVVLIGASMPSVLAEIGFLTNAGDEALLRKPEHRQKIAEALYKGISSYADTLSHFQVAKRD